MSPYNRLSPKKIFLQHLHEHDSTGTVHRSVFAVGAVDSVPLDSVLQRTAAKLESVTASGWEWQVSLGFLCFDTSQIGLGIFQNFIGI